MSRPATTRGCAAGEIGPLFHALFQAHHRGLLKMLRARGIHVNEVEDLAMEIWIDIRRRLPDEALSFGAIRDPEELHARSRAWVMVFGRLRAMRWRRDKRRRPELLGAEPLSEVFDAQDDIDVSLTRDERYARVNLALQALRDEGSRELLRDIYFRDLSQVEAARLRGWDESKLRRALRSAQQDMQRACRRLRVET